MKKSLVSGTEDRPDRIRYEHGPTFMSHMFHSEPPKASKVATIIFIKITCIAIAINAT